MANFAVLNGTRTGIIVAMIYGFADWQFYVGAVYTFFLATALLGVSGWCLLSRVPMARLSKVFLAPVIGLCALAVVSFVSGSLGLYQGVFLYAVSWILYTLWQIFRYGKAWYCICGHWRAVINHEKQLFILIVIALFLQLPAIFGSGLKMSDGVDFYFTNNGDGLMHLGFINALVQEFPPVRPEINLPLNNYHYWSDLVMAQFVRLGVPVVNLFFQYAPFLLSIWTTGLIYQSVYEVTKSWSAAFWVTMCFLLAGDGSYWLRPFFPHNHGREMATFDNGADQFLNMPYCFAKYIFFGAWLLLNNFWQTKRRTSLACLLLLIIALPLFKVYWWLLFLSGWGVSLLVRLFAKSSKKIVQNWQATRSEWLAVILLIVGGWCLLQTVMTQGSETLFWSPLVWPRVLISADHLAWDEWFLREPTLVMTYGWRYWCDQVFLVIIALIFVYGARLLGFVLNKKCVQILQAKNAAFFLLPAGVWIVIGFNFIQGTGMLNSFNFLVIAAVALLVPLGVLLSTWWQRRGGRWLVGVVLVLLAPRTLDNACFYAIQTLTRQPHAVRHYETARLALLAKLQQVTTWSDVILVNYDNQDLRAASVVPALAGRKTFLSNQDILATHSLDFASREQRVRDIFEVETVEDFLARASELSVKYVYLETYDVDKLGWIWPEERLVASSDAGLIISVP